MASQFRWTSKSVDLLHRVVSVASLRQRGLGDLLGREQEDLEGTGDDGTLRQRRVEFRHGASAAKSPCRCCTAPVQASSFNGLRCPSWSVGRGLGGEREEHGKLPAMAGGQGELPPTEGGYVPSPTTAVSFGFWSGHQPPAPQASGTTIRSSLAGDPGFPSARCGSAPSRPLLARQARGCFVRQDERLRVLGFQMLRLPPFTPRRLLVPLAAQPSDAGYLFATQRRGCRAFRSGSINYFLLLLLSCRFQCAALPETGVPSSRAAKCPQPAASWSGQLLPTSSSATTTTTPRSLRRDLVPVPASIRDTRCERLASSRRWRLCSPATLPRRSGSSTS